MPRSPFLESKREFKRELTLYESLHGYFHTSFKELLLNSVNNDNIKQLPPKLFYPVAIILQIIVLSYVIQVFVTGYYSSVNQQYLSPVVNSGDCTPVPVANSGFYLATVNGSWQGSLGFSFSLAAYQLTISNFATSQSFYQNQMNIIYYSLKFLANNVTIYQDLAQNLIYWTNVVYVASIGNVYQASQRFSLTGTPLAILNRQYTYGSVGNINGVCDAKSETNNDPTNGVLTLSYEYDDFISNPSCNTTLVPDYFGYTSGYSQSKFTITVDSRSVFTAIAINNRILDVNSIVEIIQKRANYTYNNHTYPYSSFYDPRYPGMDPIFCFNGAAGDWYIITEEHPFFCMVAAGTTFAMPIFSHSGLTTQYPVACNCTELEILSELLKINSTYGTEYANYLFNCNSFQFFTGLVLWPNLFANSPDPFIESYIENVGYSQYSNRVFTSTFYSSVLTFSSIYKNDFMNPNIRSKIFDFCNNPLYGNCSIIAFTSYDYSQASNWAISDFNYQLNNGACSSAIIGTYEEWNNLVKTPFAPLSQQYEICRNNPTRVFQNQLGSAVGNIGIIAPVAAMTILFFIYIYQSVTGINIPKSYAKSEKDASLDELSVALLLARDQKLSILDNENNEYLRESEISVTPQDTDKFSISKTDRDTKSVTNKSNRKSTISKLVKELIILAKYSKKAQFKEDIPEPVTINWSQMMKKVGKKAKNVVLYPISSSVLASRESIMSNNDSIHGRNTSVANVISPLQILSSNHSISDDHRISGIELGKIEHYENHNKIIVLNEIHGIELNNQNNKSGTKEYISNQKDLLELMDEILQKFNQFLKHRSQLNDDPINIWSVIPKTSHLKAIPKSVFFMDEENKNEENHNNQTEFHSLFHSKLVELIRLHACIHFNCEENKIIEDYNNIAAYNINGQIITLNDAIHKVGLLKL
eukprot:gene11585-15517_t